MMKKHHKYKKYNCLKCGRPISHKGNCYPCNIKAKRGGSKKNHSNKNISNKAYSTYKDERGYDRNYPKHSNLLHRENAYKYIYLKNRDKYPLPFSAYDVHHIDGNKNNNHSSNLKIVTRDQHKEIHQDDKLKRHLMAMRPWERKKWIANHYGDFSFIRLLFISNLELGNRFIIGLKLAMKVGFILGIILVIVGFIAVKPLMILGQFLIGIGILSFIILILLSIIGWIYNKVGNVWDQGKQVFGK